MFTLALIFSENTKIHISLWNYKGLCFMFRGENEVLYLKRKRIEGNKQKKKSPGPRATPALVL